MEIQINDPNISYVNIASHLGIERGTVLVVASDIKRLFFFETEQCRDFPDINLLIDSLYDAVGIEGTIVIPVFNWDFCKGVAFDYCKTKGKTGVLGNAALKRKDFKRTAHPLYSFMVKGKYQEYLCSLDNKDSFGPGTPFDFFFKVGAKQLLIDVNVHQGFTFIHHMEHLCAVPYRFNKDFTAKYIDEKKDVTTRTYSMYVRDYSLNAEQNFMPMHEVLYNDLSTRNFIINDIVFTILDIQKCKAIIEDDIINNRCRKIAKYDGQDD